MVGVAADWVTLDGIQAANLPADPWAQGLAGLVGRIVPRLRGGEGTVLLSRPAAESLGLHGPDDVRERLTGAGWRVGIPGAWTTAFRVPGPAVHVCVLPWVTADATAAERWPWGKGLAASAAGESSDLMDLARLLAAYDRLTGAPFRARPGVAGVAAMRATFRPGRGKPPLWIANHGPHGQCVDGPLSWERDPDPEEEAAGWRHDYDVVAQYLAAAGVASLARDPLRATGPQLFDRELAGYWAFPAEQAAAAAAAWPRMPPAVTELPGGDLVWVSTPTVALLEDQGFPVEIRDSWTAKGFRLLRTWAEQLRDALAGSRTDPVLHKAIKRTYTEAVGLLRTSEGRVSRPDWWATITATARCNLLRKVIEFGTAEIDPRWPLVVATDCLTYASDRSDWARSAPTGMVVGDALGQFHKPEKGQRL